MRRHLITFAAVIGLIAAGIVFGPRSVVRDDANRPTVGTAADLIEPDDVPTAVIDDPEVTERVAAAGRPAEPVASLPLPLPGADRERSGRVVDVRDFGAKGDGQTDDTDAIQRANDEIARGGRVGGRVHFPAGTYVAAGVIQDSFVEFSGNAGAVLKHPDGVSPRHIVRSRVHETTGSIDRGSNVLTVRSTRGAIPGAVIAVRAAGTPSTTQIAKLAAPMTSTSGSMDVDRAYGFSSGSTVTTNLLQVGSEIISYQFLKSKTMRNLRRGLFGTRATVHAAGTRVAQARVLYAHVVSVEGDRVRIDQRSDRSVEDTEVSIGAVAPAIRDLTLDGNRQPGGSPATNPFPVAYELATRAAVQGCTIRNGDHGAINLDKGTELSVIEDNVLTSNGSPASGLGSHVWLFRGARDNIVRGNVINGASHNGVTIDDRTIASTEWDADASENLIEKNTLEIGESRTNAAVWILGSSRNVVRGNVMHGSASGIRVYTGGQSPVPPPTTRNTVTSNTLRDHGIGMWTNGSRNLFIGNRLSDVRRPFVDEGRDNEFS